jgi:hypothetical protein
MKFKHLSLALVTFLIIIGVSSTLLIRHVTAQQIPELAWKCLPPPLHGKNLDIRKSELLEGIIEDKVSTYLIVRMRYRDAPLFEDQNEPQEYVGRFAIALEGGDCFNLNDPRTAADFNFSSRIPTLPEPIAKEIALQFWRKNLAWAGNDKEELKASILQPEDGESTAAIYAEDQWALKQLGIDVPLIEPNVGPVTYEGLWQLRYGDRQKKPTPAPSGELFENERRQIQQIEKRKW